MATEPTWLSYKKAHRWEAQAASRGVSRVARSRRGFMRVYEAAGSPHAMTPYWRRRRRNFIARHVAQLRKRREPLYDKSGRPTRRHLALLMWAYTPDRDLR